MCGRFNVIDNPGLQQLLEDLGVDLKLPPAINIAPTEQVPLVRLGGELHSARWWLTPSWAPRVEQKYAMFNARSETLASSRAFRQPFKRQRGIVPMSSFIEWRLEAGAKQPYLIQPNSGAFAAAALWDLWPRGDDEPLLSCTIVTTAAAPTFSPWHKRMPVMLQASDFERWLDNDQTIASTDDIFRPELKASMSVVPLAKAVGNARQKHLELLAPCGDSVELTAPGQASGDD